MAANQVVRIGDIGFLFQPEVIDYLAASNEEIPDGEEHARLFLADRLHLDSTGLGVFLAGRKVAVLAARGGFLELERIRKAQSLRALIPLSIHTIVKILARKHEVVIVCGSGTAVPQDFEMCWNESGNFQSRRLSLSVTRLSEALAGLFGNPIADLVDFFDRGIALPDTAEKLPDDSNAWRNLSRMQSIFQRLAGEIREILPKAKGPICLFGDLARSLRFVRLFQNFIHRPIVPVSETRPILQAFGQEIRVFPPPRRFQVPGTVLAALGIIILFNLYYCQNLLYTDLEFLKGIESLHRSLAGVQESRGGPPFGSEDIAWLNQLLEERQVSWTWLFNDLEAAKPDGVQVEGIECQSVPRPPQSASPLPARPQSIPAGRPAGMGWTAGFEIRGMADSVAAVRGFLASLQEVTRFRNVFLSSYRLKGSKFQFVLSLQYQPADSDLEKIRGANE